VVASAKTKAKAQAQAGKKEDETVVIIGGGSGGIHAIESLRMNGWAGKIVVISEEAYAPIDRWVPSVTDRG
jgi:NADH dehydrogenase FAD-containing subunit